jgi:multidrug efflux pump subunit AcrA (membrane-fusion protein)
MALAMASCVLPLPGSRPVEDAAQPRAGSRDSSSRAAVLIGTPSAGRLTAPVTRGSIQEVLNLNGRVVAQREALLYFRTAGRLRDVYVEAGQDVEAGQLLAELETGQLEADLLSAEIRYEQALLRHEQARATLEKNRQARAASAQAARVAIEQAQARVDAALLALERTRQAARPEEVLAARSQARAAQGALSQALVQLARLGEEATARQAFLKEGQAVLAQARARLMQAESQPSVQSPVVAAVERQQQALAAEAEARRAERELSAAEVDLQRARDELAQAAQGPDLSRLAAAQAQVQAKELALQAAQRTLERARGRPNEPDARLAVQQAQADLAAARAALAQASAPPDPSLLEMLRQKVRALEARVEAARAAFITASEAARAAQAAAALPFAEGAAHAEAASARAGFDVATLRLDALQGEQYVREAQLAVAQAEAARMALTAAQARLDAVLSEPSAFDVRQAEAAVDAARIALAQARAAYEQAAAGSEADQYAVALAEQNVEISRIALEVRRQQYQSTQLIAPFRGRVMQVYAQAGEWMSLGRPLILLADLDDMRVRLEVPADQVSKLALGQRATVRLDAFPLEPVPGVVDVLPVDLSTAEGATTQAQQQQQNPQTAALRSATLRVQWPKPLGQLGMRASAVIVVQQKDGVLKVPRQALKQVGRKYTVDILDGYVKRTVPVEVGIVGETEAEILGGLIEGQLIVLPR